MDIGNAILFIDNGDLSKLVELMDQGGDCPNDDDVSSFCRLFEVKITSELFSNSRTDGVPKKNNQSQNFKTSFRSSY